MNGETQAAAVARKRLAFAASRRSILEMEQLLARFLERELTGLDQGDCEEFMKLLQFSDLDLLNWVLGVTEPPNDVNPALLERLRQHR